LSLPNGLGVGTHTISAVYGGDTNFVGSTSSSITKTVAAVATTTKVTASANPVTTGASVTFTADVAQYLSSATGSKLATLPTGTVTFYDGKTYLGVEPVDTTGAAQFSTTFTTAGSQPILASYSGDSIYAASTATLSEMVQATTTTQLTSSANPSVYGQSVTFTAAVTTSDPVTTSGTTSTGTVVSGTVSFTVDQGTPVNEPLVNGTAKFSTSGLGLGPHTVVASYNGTTLFTTSEASLSQVVNQANTVTSLGYSGSFIYGQPLTLTATVSPQAPGSGRPTGTVIFMDGSTPLGPATLGVSPANGATTSSNSATLILPNGLSVGTHTISAVYGGDTNFLGSTSSTLTKTVTAVATVTQLTTTVNPVVVGQSVTLTATIGAATASGTSLKLSGTPTGFVQFFDGTTLLAVVPVGANGVATLSTSFTTTGTHAIRAVYSGDAIYGTSYATLSESVVTSLTTKVQTGVAPSNAALDAVFANLN
jgi:hypothetical protein